MYKFIKLRYDLHKITASDVWAYADSGVITSEETIRICGARP